MDGITTYSTIVIFIKGVKGQVQHHVVCDVKSRVENLTESLPINVGNGVNLVVNVQQCMTLQIIFHIWNNRENCLEILNS